MIKHIVIALLVSHVSSHPGPREDCEVPARINSGCLCGVRRVSDDDKQYASFLGVPYASQPVGENRFKELQPVEPWSHWYDATTEGPICPQHDVVYGPLMTNRNMSEACIFANIHVPISALPGNVPRPSIVLQPPYQTGLLEVEESPGLPILVFIHGGGFAYGSGSTDLHGAEFLMNKEMIVITFNYRLNIFGFLSLKSASIPGNNGLRDVVTLLKWVRDNAQYFGGDPDDVTIAGQSAGAAMAHLLTLSKSTEGLFRRAILMSGVGIHSFFTASPVFAEFTANMLLSYLAINTTDPDEIHQKLTALPLEVLMEANKQIQNQFGLTVFAPVVETPFPNVMTVIDDDPEILISKGRGNNIPLIIGFTDAECETFRRNFEDVDVLNLLKQNPLLSLPPSLVYKTPPNISLKLAAKVQSRYFGNSPTIDKYVKFCSDMYYIRPAIKLAEIRATTESAPVFLYQYRYESEFSAIKDVKGLKFNGAGHIEDLTFIFKSNSLEGTKGFSPPTMRDYMMREWMTDFVANFMYCDDPVCNQRPVSTWPKVHRRLPVEYQDIETPKLLRVSAPTPEQQAMTQFFDRLENSTS